METNQAKEAAVLSLCNILASVEERLRSVRFHLDPAHTGKGVTTGENRYSAKHLANAILDRLADQVEPALSEVAREALYNARKDARCE